MISQQRYKRLQFQYHDATVPIECLMSIVISHNFQKYCLNFYFYFFSIAAFTVFEWGGDIRTMATLSISQEYTAQNV